MYKSIGGYFLKRSLRTNFENIFWVGEKWSLPIDQNIVVYSNHHSYYDGYLAWWFFSQHLNRPYNVWMEEFDRFPQFGPMGAMPFSKTDSKSRASTIRKSAKLLEEIRGQVIHFMPSGELRPPQSGIGPFKADLARFDKIFGDKMWLPFAIYLSWNGGPKPIAFLSAGPSHSHADGNEIERLRSLLKETQERSLDPAEILMNGTTPTQNKWDFSFTKYFFKN